MPRPLNKTEEQTLEFVRGTTAEITPGVVAYALTIERHVALAALELLAARGEIRTVQRKGILGRPVGFYCSEAYYREWKRQGELAAQLARQNKAPIRRVASALGRV